MKTLLKKINVVILLLVFMTLNAQPAHGGDLEPSGPPDSTMKTLDEVEPRTAIPASETRTGTYTISESGSYYLAGDRYCGDTGIQVDANDVTIDLMGHVLKGPGPGDSYGILVSNQSNVEIRNGTIRDFGMGIRETGDGFGHCIIRVRSMYNADRGISLDGNSHSVKDCSVCHNGTSSDASEVSGIYVEKSSNVTGNTVYSNGTGASTSGSFVYAIQTGIGCIVRNNAVYDNGNSARGTVYGVYSLGGGTIFKNTVYENGNSALGIVYGIYGGDGGLVLHNNVYQNGTSATGTHVYGIHCGYVCTVIGNTARSNGNSANGLCYGIYLYNGQSLVDRNTSFGHSESNMNDPGNCTFGINHAP